MHSSIIHKAIGLLSVIGDNKRPMTFTDIVIATTYNKSTTHRLLSILSHENLIQFDESTKTYFLGSKLFDLVRNAHSGYDIQAVSLDEMIRLHKLTSLNIALGVLEVDEVVYIRLLEAKQSWGNMTRPMMRESLHYSASGKALTAYLDKSVITAKLNSYNFSKKTPRTITDTASYLSTLADVRKQGYASNDREEYEHLVGISVPIFNYLGEAIAAINIWSLHSENSLADLMDWRNELMTSAKKITELIGGITPHIEES